MNTEPIVAFLATMGDAATVLLGAIKFLNIAWIHYSLKWGLEKKDFES